MMISGIEHRGNFGGEYFTLLKSKTSKYDLKYYLDQFNIDDYHIMKSTRNFKIADVQDVYDFKCAQYIFFLKSKYTLKWIEDWLYLFEELNITMTFLHKPFPPEYVKSMIKVIDEM